MTHSDVVSHFGSAAIACAKLNIPPQTFSSWKTRGRIPFNAQYAIQLKTRGRLRADVAALEKAKAA